MKTKIFYSEEEHSKLSYIKQILLAIVWVFAAHFLYQFKISNRDTPTSVIWAFDFFVGLVITIWILASKIVKQMELDFVNRKFVINYFTVFKSNENLEVLFDNLAFTFEKQPTFRQPKKWNLVIFDNSTKVFSIETSKDGFSQDTLEYLTDELNKIVIVS